MSVWGEIKKALNSTLGTEGFKPLDEIIKDAGFKPHLKVTVSENATVTVTDGITTYTQSGNDELDFFLNSYGIWDITAVSSTSKTKSTNVSVLTAGYYSIVVDFDAVTGMDVVKGGELELIYQETLLGQPQYMISVDAHGRALNLKKAIVVIPQASASNLGYAVSAYFNTQGTSQSISGYIRENMSNPKYYSGRVEFTRDGGWWKVDGVCNYGSSFYDNPSEQIVSTKPIWDNNLGELYYKDDTIKLLNVRVAGTASQIYGNTISVYGIRA